MTLQFSPKCVPKIIGNKLKQVPVHACSDQHKSQKSDAETVQTVNGWIKLNMINPYNALLFSLKKESADLFCSVREADVRRSPIV